MKKIMAYKTIYKPKKLKKYIGNAKNIICRSLWERSFAIWCDKNKEIKRWSVEPFAISYFDVARNKNRKYYPDFYIEFDDGRKFIIEVKPFRQTKEPTNKKSKQYIYEKYTYITNVCKWEQAKKLCKQKGWEFVLFTEKQFDHYGIKILKKPPQNQKKPTKRRKQNYRNNKNYKR